MNKRLLDRLVTLEDRNRRLTTGIVRLGFCTDDRGDISAYRLLDLGRTLTPDEFDALLDEWPDVVFFPSEIPDRAHKAYYELEEEAILEVSWADLQAENEEAARMTEEGTAFEGPGVIEAAFDRARAADPERAALASEYAEGWVESCEWFYGPMRERAERMSATRGANV